MAESSNQPAGGQAADVTVDRLRLVGAPETNKVMAGEFSRLVRRALDNVRLAPPKKRGTGQLLYPFDPAVARVAAVYHRTASRVLWDLYESRARRLEPLYDELVQAMADDRRGWRWDGATFSVVARNVDGFAAGPRQIVGTVKNAIIDAAAARAMTLRVDAEDPDLLVHVRMHDDQLSVSVDLAGRAMHLRGYRARGGAAPLRENLAATLLMLARYDARTEVLVDPMAGSGTIAIEGALMARAEPLWASDGGRPLAFERMPAFAELVGAPAPALFADTQPRVWASDIDHRTLAIARQNATGAGVTESLRLRAANALSLKRDDILGAFGAAPDTPGLIVSNPPYGERLGGDEVVDLYRELAQWLRGFSGWRAAFLVAHPDFERVVGLRPRIRKPLNNGPLRAYFLLYDL